MNRFADETTYSRMVTRDYAEHHGLRINPKYSVVDSRPEEGWEWVIVDLPIWWDTEMAAGGETYDIG